MSYAHAKQNQPEQLADRKFDRLTPLGIERRGGRVFWLCQCDCGNTTVVAADKLKSHSTKSCGCLRHEGQSRRAAARNFKHGKSGTKEHWAWRNIKDRCYNKNYPHYDRYGGRGITVCDKWRDSFETFLADMGPCPGPEYSIDRYPNNDGNYEPGNCRWATTKEQARNRRNNTLLTWNGETLPLAAWAERTGLDVNIISIRIKRLRWPVEKAMTTPPRRTKRRT